MHHTLGTGFLKKVYANARAHGLGRANSLGRAAALHDVTYDNVVVGQCVSDLLVDGIILVEPKTVRTLDDIHMAQCLNYLMATALNLCLLLIFGTPRLQIKRLVMDL